MTDKNKEKEVKITDVAKVVLIGEAGVGKTSLIARFVNDAFDPNSSSSLGASFTAKTINFPEFQRQLKFDIWDTAGQEKYRALTKVLYKDAKVIIFVYDITNLKSFEAITDFWYGTINDSIAKPPVYAIAANKSDLYEKEEVDEAQAKEFAEKIGAIFKTTSALSNEGIDTLFNYIGKKIIDKAFNYIDDEKGDVDIEDEFTLDDRVIRDRDEMGRSRCC